MFSKLFCIECKIILYHLALQSKFRLDVPIPYKYLICGRKAIDFRCESKICDLFFCHSLNSDELQIINVYGEKLRKAKNVL